MIFFITFGLSSPVLANWTLNLGYHNPPGATVGVNFLYFSSDWAFEVGIGWVDADAETDDEDDDAADTSDDDDEDSVSVRASGALNFKYFLGSGGFRPYLQIGVGAGIGAKAGDDDSGVGAGVGGGYGGLGIMAGSPSFYGYASYNIGRGSDGFIQLGFGFDI
ncbi:hypothetical protein [Pseudobacteriovorax antillogorgiicola]|uniref:hypothetical protein n=1 Tax=Pseudobacteriovorax antillogorgiicola TaxID=1513793 RepID=UPI001F22901E|nr:hypothetical protein [Pseudobacteriovorax antillogorgiicola]